MHIGISFFTAYATHTDHLTENCSKKKIRIPTSLLGFFVMYPDALRITH